MFIIAKTGKVLPKKQKQKQTVFEERILISLSVKLSAIKWCRE